MADSKQPPILAYKSGGLGPESVDVKWQKVQAEEFDRTHRLCLPFLQGNINAMDEFYENVVKAIDNWGSRIFNQDWSKDKKNERCVLLKLQATSATTFYSRDAAAEPQVLRGKNKYCKKVLVTKTQNPNKSDTVQTYIEFQGDEQLIRFFKEVVEPSLVELEKRHSRASGAEDDDDDDDGAPFWEAINKSGGISLVNSQGAWVRRKKKDGSGLMQWHMRETNASITSVQSKVVGRRVQLYPTPSDKGVFLFRILPKGAELSNPDVVMPNEEEDQVLHARFTANPIRAKNEEDWKPFDFFGKGKDEEEEEEEQEDVFCSAELDEALMQVKLGETAVIKFKAGPDHCSDAAGVSKDDEITIAVENLEILSRECGSPNGCCYCGEGLAVDVNVVDTTEYKAVHVWYITCLGKSCRCLDCESCVKCVFCTISSCFGFCGMAMFGMA
jgi:hypothetical protein